MTKLVLSVLTVNNCWICWIFMFINIQVCTGSEQFSHRGHLKAISPCPLSSEDKQHGEIGFKCFSVNNCSDPVQTWIFTRQKSWRNWFQVFSLWIIVQIQYKPEYSWDKKHDEIDFKCSFCGLLFRSSTNLNIHKTESMTKLV